MSSEVRVEIGRLRTRFAKAFGLHVDDVGSDTVLDQGCREIGRVFAKSRTDLPVWTTGVLRVHSGKWPGE